MDYHRLEDVSKDTSALGSAVAKGGAIRAQKHLGRRQLKAVLRKNCLLKSRSLVQLFCELLTPTLMLSLLLIGWSLSTLQVEPNQIYANSTTVTIPHIKPPNNLQDADFVCLAPSVCYNSTRALEQLKEHPKMGPNNQQELKQFLSALGNYTGPFPTPSLEVFMKATNLILKILGNETQHKDNLFHLSQNRFNSLLYGGDINFVPNTPWVREVVRLMNASNPAFGTSGGTQGFHKIFDTEKEAMKWAARDGANATDRTWAVVVFHELGGTTNTTINGSVQYTIRMNYTTVPFTQVLINKFKVGLDTTYQNYIYSGFLTLQEAVDDAIFSMTASRPGLISNATPQAMNMTSVPFPISAYTENPFYQSVGPLVGFIMVMSTLYPVSRLVKNMVVEKESRTKETMLIMGLKGWVFYVSWLLTYFCIFTFISLSVALMLSNTIFPNSSTSLLLVYFFLFTTSEVAFGFMITTFFSKAKLAAIVAPIALFASSLPRYAFFRSDQTTSATSKAIISIFSPTGFTLGADLITNYEGANQGLHWSNIFDDEYPFATVLIMLAVDIVVYLLLGLYFDNVIPNEYGISKGPCFCICGRRSRWISDRKKSLAVNGSSSFRRVTSSWDGASSQFGAKADDCDAPEEEQVAQEVFSTLSVSVKGMHKVYSNGKVALKSLSLQFFEGQITSLLGHNGAGKTTLISILTGLYAPTQGSCTINGLDLATDLNKIRESVGVCPQHNVLFDMLTVKEHLELYSALKGVAPNTIEASVQQAIQDVGLSEKTDTFSQALSGGMKRKLQCAIALVGGSKVVFLDEPTSGMDPHSRRATWQLLQRSKRGRTIILTTHFMDEADMLGDRIAIMTEGNLRCVGSSLYLKTKFGAGYNLTMVRSSDKCQPSLVNEMVLKHMPSAKLTTAAGGELTYQLPFSEEIKDPNDDAGVATLLKELEDRRQDLFIGGYGISITTLEEVFLSLTRSMHSKGKGENKGAVVVETGQLGSHQNEKLLQELRSATGRGSTFFQQLAILFKKRFTNAKRDKMGRCFELLLPVGIVALVLLILLLNVDPAGPPIELSAALFAHPAFQASSADSGPSPNVLYSKGLDPAIVDSLRGPGGVKDPFLTLTPTNETTSLGISEVLLMQADQHADQRWGAYVANDTVDFHVFEMSHKDPESILNFSMHSGLCVLHNSSSFHALPSFLATYQEAKYRALTGDLAASYKVSSYPLPLTKRTELQIETFLSLFTAIFVLIPFCYLPASFVIFIVKERKLQSKHLQLVSGVSINAYWASTFLWDTVNYLFISLCVLGVFKAYGNAEFAGDMESTVGTYLLIVLYGLAALPLSYCYSFGFSSHTSALVSVLGLHFVAGFVCVIANFIMKTIPDTRDANDVLVQFYRLLPPFNFGEGLINICTRSIVTSNGLAQSVWDWEVVGRNYVYLAGECVFFCALTLAIDHGWVGKLKEFVAGKNDYSHVPDPDQTTVMFDEDVRAEADRVLLGEKDNEIVVIKNLRKVYGKSGRTSSLKHAVRDMNIAIPKGQVFGLLGVNGAGKTSTLQILTGDQVATSGSASVAGFDIAKQILQVRQRIGYCPQFDPLLPLMTGRETLQMFGELRGLPAGDLELIVARMLQLLSLSQYADKTAGSYSGGNKRKLSLGVALLGNPAVIFLDEPSTGMDPLARRYMWDLISSISNSIDTSIVLTTHSMEECEALCNRVAIMVNGRFRCLGSSQHLKSRFGGGYSLEIKISISASKQAVTEITNFVARAMPGSKYEDDATSNKVKFSLKREDDGGLPLSRLFELLEEAKKTLAIEAFSISQNTLEQIFVDICKDQEADSRDSANMEDSGLELLETRDSVITLI